MTEPSCDFVVFSDDWGRHPSSCQHLFNRISRNHRVLWVNTIGLRSAGANSFTFFRGLEKIREWCRPLRKIHDNLSVFAPVMLPVSDDTFLSRLNRNLTAWMIRRVLRKMNFQSPILWTTVPTAADYLGKIGESACVYYVTDDYSRWPGANAQTILRQDQQLTQNATVIFACNPLLTQNHSSSTKQAVHLPHAVDYPHFSQPQSEPSDLQSIPHPRICFFGLIYEKIDLDTLYDLAESEPNYQLVMIGPVKTNIDRFKTLPNVHFLGPKNYDELPAWLHAMDVFVIPYILDDETQAKGPLKIRECLAVGKPTVARSIPDLTDFSQVLHLYDHREDFPAMVRSALSIDREKIKNQMQKYVQSETWEARVETILSTLKENNHTTVLTSNDPPDWNNFLTHHPYTTLFHDPRWGAVMKNVYGNAPFYLTAKRDGKIVGTLQLVEQKSRLFGSHLCSLPYFDAAGILADNDQSAHRLIEQAQKLLLLRGVKWIELRHNKKTSASLPARDDKVDMLLPLPEHSDILWNQLDAKVRNQIRKAQSQGLTLQTGSIDLLDDFHTVYVRNMRDLGSPPHSRKFFKSILDSFSQNVRIYIIRSNQTPVAGGFTLTDKNRLYLPWAASDWRAKAQCPNMLLYWSMLSDGIDRGCKIFDFGRSTRESGTYRFKKQWGAQESPLVWQYLLAPDQPPPALRPDSPKYHLFVQCWQKLPLPMTRAIGPFIISRLS